MTTQKETITLLADLMGIEETEIKAEMSLDNDLGFDSLFRSELAMILEERHECLITLEEIRALDTVSHVIDFICKIKKASKAN